MSYSWFRLYSEVLNDPKVQCLSGEHFKTWINILCIASKNHGVLPDMEALQFLLRATPEAVTEALASQAAYRYKKSAWRSFTASQLGKKTI
jgi:hypothetical protein